MSKILDVRDLIEEFEAEEDTLQNEFNQLLKDDPKFAEQYDESDFEEWAENHEGEYLRLKRILKQLAGYGGDEQWRGDWYPVTLIREDGFTDYCRELLQDCGMLPNNLPSFIEFNINWDGVTDDMKQDYSCVEIDGDTYWYR